MYEFLGKPFGWLLYGLFSLGIHNYALLIVLLTLIVRLIMIPSSISQQKGMAKTQRIQAKIRKIQQKYAGDQKKIQEETQLLYQREGYNPMNAGCAPMAIQFVLLFGLIGVIYYPLSNFLHFDDTTVTNLKLAVQALGYPAPLNNARFYELIVFDHVAELKAIWQAKASVISEIAIDGKNYDIYNDLLKDIKPEVFDKLEMVGFRAFGISLGDIPKDSKFPSLIWLIPIISTLTTVASSLISTLRQKQSGQGNAAAAKSMGCMTVGMALFSLYFVVSYPAGIGVYWIASGVLGLASTLIIGQLYNPRKQLARIMIDETIEHRSKENMIKIAASIKEEKEETNK